VESSSAEPKTHQRERVASEIFDKKGLLRLSERICNVSAVAIKHAVMLFKRI
jgi:hypothetical protein